MAGMVVMVVKDGGEVIPEEEAGMKVEGCGGGLRGNGGLPSNI